MLKIFNYSMYYSLRKKSTIILLLILALASFGIPYLIGDTLGKALPVGTPYIETVFENPITAISFYIFYSVFLMSYLAIKALNINKDGEIDGSTLLLVSKKFTRSDIIIGRFMAIIIHLFLAAISAFAGIAMANSLLEGSNFSYPLSIFVGTLLIGMVFVAFASLLSTVMGKVATMFIGIVSSLGIVITNSIFTAIGDGNQFSNILKYNNNRDFTNNFTSYLDGKGNIINSFDTNSNEISSLLNEKYRTYAYLDVWYQISSTLTMFTGKDVEMKTVKYSSISQDTIDKVKEDIGIKFGAGQNAQYIYQKFPTNSVDEYSSLANRSITYSSEQILKESNKLMPSDEEINEYVDLTTKALETYQDDSGNSVIPTATTAISIVEGLFYILENEKDETIVKSIKDGINNGTKIFSSAINKDFELNNELKFDGNDIHNYNDEFESKYGNFGNSSIFENFYEDRFSSNFISKSIYEKAAYRRTEWAIISSLGKTDVWLDNSKVIQPNDPATFVWNTSFTGEKIIRDNVFSSTFELVPYISKTGRVITWVVISLLLSSITFWVYYKRDFK